MKKGLRLCFAFTLAMSMAVTPVLAKPGNGKSQVSSSQKEAKSDAKSEAKSEVKSNSAATALADDDSTVESNKTEIPSQKTKSNSQANKKAFKNELNEQKKELQKEKTSLNQQVEALQIQYENMLAAGDEQGAAATLDSINELNEQIQGVKAQIKATINERFMVAKTMYTDEELGEFSSAEDLISQMYADAEVLSVGSVTVNNNLIKFDTPAYIKNGVTLVPLRAISEELGGEVSWDAETKTVTITNGDTVVQITENSTNCIVNGETIEISAPATKDCGRTYVPLRFLSEALGFNTEWDSENELIDISDSTEASGDDTTATTTEASGDDTTATTTEASEDDTTATTTEASEDDTTATTTEASEDDTTATTAEASGDDTTATTAEASGDDTTATTAGE